MKLNANMLHVARIEMVHDDLVKLLLKVMGQHIFTQNIQITFVGTTVTLFSHYLTYASSFEEEATGKKTYGNYVKIFKLTGCYLLSYNTIRQ